MNRFSRIASLVTIATMVLLLGGCGEKESSRVVQVKPHVDRGFRLYRQQQYAEAAAEWEKALEINPDLDYLKTNLAVLYVNFLERREEAKALLLEQLERSPKDASICNNLAGIYQAEGDLERAIAFYNRAVELHPQYHVPLYNLGSIYKAQGKLELSIEKLEAAVRLSPTSVETLLALAEAYGMAGNPTRAMDLLRQAKSYAQDPQASLALGREYLRRGEVASAQQELQQILDKYPTHAAAMDLSARAQLEAEGGTVQDAQKILDEVLKIHPETRFAVATTAAMIALKRGDLSLARSTLESAFPQVETLQPDREAEARFLLGHILIRQGEAEAGQAAIDQALKLDPRLGTGGEIQRLLDATAA